MQRLLRFPLKEGENIRGIIVLANKKADYTDFDIYTIEMLCMAFLEVLARKRAQIYQCKTVMQLTLRSQIDSIFLKIPDDDAYGEVLQLIMGALESPHLLFRLHL